MEKLESTGLVPLIKAEAQRKPLLGICLGMQLLFEQSCEYGLHKGLGLIPGQVRALKDDLADKSLKVPHMGWNRIGNLESKLFRGLDGGSYVYFVHSYYPELCPDTIATSQHGVMFSAALKYENFYGTQFHPEKSGDVGERIIENFLKL